MADYYPLLARAIANLPNAGREARHAVYDRARAALLAQLRGADPPLPEPDIERERRSLEDAVRRLEDEHPDPAATAPGGPTLLGDELPAEKGPVKEPSAAKAVSGADVGRTPPSPGGGFSGLTSRADDGPAVPPAPEPPAPPTRPNPPAGDAGRMESEPAHPVGTVRVGPTPRGEVRPRPEPQAVQPRPVRPAPDRAKAANAASSSPPSAGARPADRPPPAATGKSRGFRLGRLVMPAVLLAVIVTAGTVGYTQRDQIVGLLRDLRSSTSSEAPAPESPPAQAPEVAKSTDRIPQARTDPARRVAPATPAAADGTVPAVAQRAVLFEENPGGGQQSLQQYIGTVVWKTETFNPGNGRPNDVGIRATVEIPDRHLQVDISVRRNQEPNLPASHIVEIQFQVGSNFDLGSIANVPGMRAKPSEAAQGVPLNGLAVRVTPGYFLIGLSAVPSERQRNLALLFTQNWLDLPIVFGNGRRGLLVIEKGLPGDRAIRAAYAAWGITQTAGPPPPATAPQPPPLQPAPPQP